MDFLLDFFLHLDAHLAEFVQHYGVLVYVLLFAIVFAETGLVVTPFLPGDSLLFTAGALAAVGVLDIWLVVADPVGRGDPRRRSQLCGRPLPRSARILRRGRNKSLAPALESQALATGPRVLRALRRQSGGAGPVRADRPHIRAVRRRRGLDVVPAVCVLQRDGRSNVGRPLLRRRATVSATYRS